jgi:luciferase family oxidoreductase group 1
LNPGRIDLGLGRAPGTDQVTAMAIRGENMSAPNHFPQDVQQLQKLFSAGNANGKIRANPGEGLDIPIWILGSSTDSAHLAAALGLPYAFASHFAPTYFTEAINIYRKNFKPSAQLSAPYIMACVNVVAADTDVEAKHLFTSLQQFFMGVITGKRALLQPPVDSMDTIWNPYEAEAVNQMLAYAFIGGPETIRQEMQEFIAETQIDEVIVTSHIWDHQAKLKSYRLFAEALAGVGV